MAEGFERAAFPPNRSIAVAAVLVAAASILTGCAAPGTHESARAASPTRSASSTRTQAADAYSLSDADSARCSTEPTYDRLKAAFATDQITAENSTLASPDDPAIIRLGPEAVAKQKAAWDALSPADRLFEECKPFFEAGAVPAPTPTL